ncbi:MAG: hypothetical protein WCK63_12095 [Betaproteobacteria bacterium]
MSTGKGQYRRLVGKHTHLFCSRAVERSTNEIQKKILFIASAGADDFMAKKLGVQVDKKKIVFFTAKKNKLSKHVNPKSTAVAIRVYLSALMILLSNDKEIILEKVGLNETDWLNTWCGVFEYANDDKVTFNSELITQYQQEGMMGLVQAAAKQINVTLRLEDNEIDKEVESLSEALIKDANVILGVIK